MNHTELITADRRLFLSRTAEYLGQVITRIDHLREHGDLDRNRKAMRAEARIRTKVLGAKRKLAESNTAHPDAWPADRRELNGLLAEIIIDVGCLRVRTGDLEVGAPVISFQIEPPSLSSTTVSRDPRCVFPSYRGRSQGGTRLARSGRKTGAYDEFRR